MKIFSMGFYFLSFFVMFFVWVQIQDFWLEELEMYGLQFMFQKFVCDDYDFSINVIWCSIFCYSYIKKLNVLLLVVGLLFLLSVLYYYVIV